MLYEKYELKMQKIANVKKNIIKFKIPIICFFSLIMLLCTIFLSVKGMILTDIEIVSDFTYGEKISVQAEVLFGEADFEYRLVNSRSNWSKEEPFLPGTYEVRVVSNRTFGTSKGKSIEFTIFPKEVDVRVMNTSIVFGNQANFSSNLAIGDYFVSGDVLYEDYYSLSTQKVLPIVDTLVVYNKDNVDVSSAYKFTEIESSLNITKRRVEITASSASKVYDKKELISNDYSVNNLIDSHDINLDVTGSITNYGSVLNKVSNVEISVDNKDITHMYNIVAIDGRLDINKKDLYVTTSSASKVYDGTSLFNNEFTYEGLVSGDSIELLSSYSEVYFGTYDNKITVTTNSNNYNIIYTYNKLNITARNITIETNSSNSIYDGYDYFDNNLIINNLVLNDTYKVVSNTKIKYVGEIKNNLVVRLYNGTRDISNCYNITYIYGNLTILKRDVTITSLSTTKEYDGTYLEQINHDKNNLAVTDNTVVTSSTKITNVSEVKNVITVDIFNNGYDVTNCYNITYVENMLEITPRIITIKTNDNTKEYDGSSLIDSNWYYISNTKLVEGHTLSLINTSSITNVGTIENNYTDFTIKSGNTNLKDNYEVTILKGTLSVTKRNITIKTSDGEKVYDDTELTNNNYSIVKGTLVLDHIFDITVNGSITNYGVVDNTCTTPIVLSNNIDVTYNYNVEVIYGKLSISKRVINILTESDEKVYDGTNLVNHNWNYNNSLYEIINGHTDNVVYSGVQLEVGVSNNTIASFNIFKGLINVSNNYEVVIEEGTLTVTKRSVNVITGSDEKQYDGTALTKHDYSYKNSLYELVADHELIIDYTGSQLEVGESNNTYASYKVMFDNKDVTSNYNISIELGLLKVTQTKLVVTTNSNTYVYNGEYQIDEAYNITSLPNDQISIIDKIIGEKDVIVNGINKYTVKILDKGIDVTSNYDIEYVYGSLTITKREVIITTDSDEKVYDGTSLSKKTWSYEDGYEFVSFHKFSIIITGSILEVFDKDTVGTTNNTYSSFELLDEFDNDVIFNYNLTINLGTLTITHRELNVVTKSDNKVFDDIPLIADDYVVNSGSLVENQLLNIVYTGSVLSVSEGIVDNTYSSYNITSDGIDVTKNYNIVILLGKLFIETRVVNITTASDEKVYDGEALFKHELDYTIGNEYTILKDIHLFDVEYINKIVNVGAIENSIEYSIKRISDNTDLLATQDYQFIVTEGTLEITVRNISIYSFDDSKTYDGYELTNGNYDYVEDSLEVVEGESLEVIIESSIINYGATDNIILKVIINNIENNSNYNVTTINGTLTINKRDITISSADDSKVYDGDYLSNENIVVEANSNNRGIALTDTYSTSNFAKIKYYIENGIENTFDIKLFNESYDYKDFNPTDNYNINFVYGTLTINKRNITIETGSSDEVYSGTYIENREFEIISGSLALTDEIKVIDTTKLWLTTKSGIENVLTFKINHTNEDIDLSYNYKISYENGKLEMSKFKITLISASATKIYDGNKLIKSLFVTEDNEEYVIFNDRFVYSYYTDATYYNSTGIDNVLEFSIFNNDLDVTCNYEYDTPTWGKLKIEKREIYLDTGSKTFIYDGEDHYYKEWNYTENSLEFISLDGLTIKFPNFVTYASDGYKDNIIEFDLANQLAKNSYVVDYGTLGQINVIDLDISIESHSGDIEYNGCNISYGFISIIRNDETFYETEEYSLNHEIELNAKDVLYVKMTGVISAENLYSIHENSFTWKVLRDDVDVSEFYSSSISEMFGNIQIIKRKITVASESKEFDLDGKTHKWEEASVAKGTLVLDHVDEYIFSGEIDSVGEVSNTFEAFIYSGLRDVTEFYEITYIDGTLTMVPASITVNIGTNEVNPFIYNGQSQYHSIYEIDSDFDGDLKELFTIEINKDSLGTYINVDTYNNYLFEIIIKTKDGSDITHLFNPSYNPGTLVIIQRDICVSVKDNYVTYQYNGLNQTIRNSDVVITDSENNIGFGKAYFDSFNIISDSRLLGIGIIDLVFTIEFDNNNYNIIGYDIDNAKLEVIKRDLEIKLIDNVYEYNQEEQYATKFSLANNTSFANTEAERFKFDTISTTMINWVNDSWYNCNSNNFIIKFSNLRIEGLDDIYNYYNISFTSDVAYLKITQIDVLITTLGDEKVYDGEVLSKPEKVPMKGNILEGHEIDYDILGSIVNVGRLDNNIDNLRVVDTTGKLTESEVLFIYNFKYNIGELVITPKDINVLVFNLTKSYTKEETYLLEHTNYEGYILIDSLVLDHKLSVSAVEQCSNYNGIIMLKDYLVSNNSELTKNYNFIANTAVIKYIQVNVELTAASVTKEYDGEALFDWSFEYTKGYLILGHTIEVEMTSSRTVVGVTKNIIKSYKIKDSQNRELTEEEISQYYNITTIDGLLTIT